MNQEQNQYPSDPDLRKDDVATDRSKNTNGQPAIDVASSSTKTIAQLLKESVAIACGILDGFIGPSQVAALIRCCQGEEKDYFFGELIELAATVEAMPRTYEQDGKGDAAIAHLHYFTSGGSDWYITEKDMGCETDRPEDFQSQAFGLADIFGDGGELGYISIPAILSYGAELDFYFEPKTLREIRAEKNGRYRQDADTNEDETASKKELVAKVDIRTKKKGKEE